MEGQLGALRRLCFGEVGFVEQLDALDDDEYTMCARKADQAPLPLRCPKQPSYLVSHALGEPGKSMGAACSQPSHMLTSVGTVLGALQPRSTALTVSVASTALRAWSTVQPPVPAVLPACKLRALVDEDMCEPSALDSQGCWYGTQQDMACQGRGSSEAVLQCGKTRQLCPVHAAQHRHAGCIVTSVLDWGAACRKWRVISHPLNSNPFPGSFLNYKARMRLVGVTMQQVCVLDYEGEFDTEHSVRWTAPPDTEPCHP